MRTRPFRASQLGLTLRGLETDRTCRQGVVLVKPGEMQAAAPGAVPEPLSASRVFAVQRGAKVPGLAESYSAERLHPPTAGELSFILSRECCNHSS